MYIRGLFEKHLDFSSKTNTSLKSTLKIIMNVKFDIRLVVKVYSFFTTAMSKSYFRLCDNLWYRDATQPQ